MNSIKKGFTLAELLIAVTIIAIITTASVSIYSQSIKRARDAQRIADMESIRTALEAYYIDNGHYPGEQSDPPPEGAIPVRGQFIGVGDRCEGINNFGCNAWGSIDDYLEPYMDHVPKDPLHDPTDAVPQYYYAYDPSHIVTSAQRCNQSDPTHPFWNGVPDCPDSCAVINMGVVFGFRRSETRNIDQLTYETCAGTNQELRDAHYNVVLRPSSP